MITLFRRIRQKLIDSGSVKKYLLYAIGEILLVVIGILIALQVNNWNEERKVRQSEKFLLGELQKEFSTNLDLVQRDYLGNSDTQDAILDLLSLFEKREVEDYDRLDSLFVSVFMNTTFDPTTGVVNEIISTGRLNVLRDDSLRYLISQWPSVLKDQQEDIDIRWGHFETFLLPGLIRSYPMKNVNRYMDFSFWSDSYQRETLPASTFSFDPESFFTAELEGMLYLHSLNQDFILMNDLKTEKYIRRILHRISQNLN